MKHFFEHNSIQKLNQFPRMFTEQKYGDVPHESWWPIEYATEWLIQNSGSYLVETSEIAQNSGSFFKHLWAISDANPFWFPSLP